MPTLRGRRVLIASGTLLIAVAMFVAGVSALAVRVNGASMTPTLHDGDRVLLRPFSGGRTPDRGALVVARFTEHGAQVLKRVIAVAGDQVEIRAGAVRLQPGGSGPWFVVHHRAWEDGSPTDSACCTAQGRSAPGAGAVRVPPGMVFLLGDEPELSTDSRQEGWVPIERIGGRVWWRIHPPGRWGTPGGELVLSTTD